MNISEALAWATDHLQKHQIEDARLESEILLAHALGIKKTNLYAHPENTFPSHHLSIFQSYIKRRAQHEPTAYITGIQPFMSLDFFVDHSVLIPRPETEQLVETVSRVTGRGSWVAIADIGTGSGAIAVSLAKHLPYARVIGIDSSAEAIKIAQRNAEAHKVTDRCQFIVGNMFELSTEKVDIIVSNPPYIPTAEIETLQPEVKDWEPRQALDGGKDGLDHIRKILEEAPNHQTLFLEFGFNQADKVEQLARKYYREIGIIKDYSGIPRILKARV